MTSVAVASRPPHRSFVAENRLIGVLAVSLAIVFSAACVYLIFRSSPAAPVVYPLATLLGAATIFFGVVWKRERGTPFMNLGGFAALMTVIYAVYPVVVYMLNGLAYSPNSDVRMWIAQPPPARIGALTWWYVIYFVAFASVYLVVSGRGGKTRFEINPAPRQMIWLIVILFGVIEAINAAVVSMFDLSFDSYEQSYVVVRRLPLAVRQIFLNVVPMRTTLLVLLMCVLFANYKRRRIWIVLIVLWVVGMKLRAQGARAELFIILVLVGVLYHNFVRRIPLYKAALAGVTLLALMTWMGVVRAGGKVTFRPGSIGTSEFEAILSNAYDLRYTQQASGIMRDRPELYFCDFTSVVPQQLLPFQKMNKSAWYGETYFPEATANGVGFAFGVLAEAVTGWGWPDLIVRGVLVGAFFGWFHRRISTRPVSLWQLAFYLWLTVFSYQLVRNTTFGLLQWAEYHFLVPMVAIRGGYYLLWRARQRPALS